jgi:hypothetical protein
MPTWETLWGFIALWTSIAIGAISLNSPIIFVVGLLASIAYCVTVGYIYRSKFKY